MNDGKPLRVNAVEEETAFRSAAKEVISLILNENPDRTLIDIAEKISVTVRTISNAFNKNYSLSEVYLRRLGQAYGSDKLDPWARLLGARLTPLEADEAADALPPVSAVVHRLTLVRTPGRPVHTELLNMEGDIDAAIKALTALKVRAQAIRSAA